MNGERTLVCDFCEIPLVGHAWEYPARDISYDNPRIGPDGPPIQGSLGGWLACDGCAALINRTERDKLASRSLERLLAEHKEWVKRAGGQSVVFQGIRQMHDSFWAARDGDPVRVEHEQLDEIAREPLYVEADEHFGAGQAATRSAARMRRHLFVGFVFLLAVTLPWDLAGVYRVEVAVAGAVVGIAGMIISAYINDRHAGPR